MQDKKPLDLQATLDKGMKAQHELSLMGERIETFKKEVMVGLTLCTPKMDQERRNLCQALQIADKVYDYLLLDVNQAKHAKNKIVEISKVGRLSLLDKILP